MDKSTIISAVLDMVSVPFPQMKHFHVCCNNEYHQEKFVSELKSAQENLSTAVVEADCRMLGSDPRDLYEVFMEAIDSPVTKPIRHADDFPTLFVNALGPNPSPVVICLRNSEILHEFEQYPVVQELFGGFGSAQFIKLVSLVTLANVPWSLLLNNPTISPMVMNFNLLKKRKLGKEVIRYATHRHGGENLPFSRTFAEQCVSIFEEHTSDPIKLYSLVSLVAYKCKNTTINPLDSTIDNSALRKIAQFHENVIYFQEVVSTATADLLERISYYGKFILISAYCCSYNRTSTDMRYFCKEREGSKRTLKKSENKFHELGPQAFTLDRLHGITSFFLYHFAIDPKKCPSFDILINNLVDMRLLTRITAPQNLSNMKFRCNATLEMANLAAKDIGLDNGLADFLDEDPSNLVSKLANFNIDG